MSEKKSLRELAEANEKQKQKVAERKAAEVALRESELRFKGLFEDMSSGVAVYEAVDNGENFVFKEFNKAGKRIEDVNRDDIIGARVTEAFPGVEGSGLIEVFKRVWRTGKSEYFPEAIHKDERDPGSRYENWVYKLPGGEIVAMYNDISERKQMEEEIQNRISELEQFTRFTVDREQRMIELKREVNELYERLGEKPPYDLSFAEKNKKNENG